MNKFKIIGCDKNLQEIFGPVVGETFCFGGSLNENRIVAIRAEDGERWIIPAAGVDCEEIMFEG